LPQTPLPQVGTSKTQSSDTADTTRTVMNIVAGKHDAGGITFGDIYQALKDRGIDITRMYLHTILNRKKNRQKKLEKRGDKWFLTAKGKEELGLSN
jgi:predicted transcriptional regulator